MAEQGYVTIVFDASCQGESEGEPRFAEIPAARVEDIRSAVDYLTTLDCVDENRIGILGVCYAVNAAMTERRIKAVGTVVGANIGRVQRESGDPIKALEAIAQQRTAEAQGAETMISGWIPCNQEEREQAGMNDIDIVEAVDYSDDAVIITNLAEKPFVGKEEVAAYCRGLVKKGDSQITALTSPNKKIYVREAVGELACLGFFHKESKQHGVLTQRVQNGKIVFESSVFKDASPIF